MHVEIYSPYTPSTYTRSGEGHGEWYGLDIPKWNLVWLSVPQLDLYHDDSLSIDRIMSSIDHEYVGTVAASLHPDLVDIYPNLRSLLSGSKSQFMTQFLKGPWSQLPAYTMYGMTWIDTMRERAQSKTLRRVAQAIAKQTEQRVADNVIDFGSYRRNR